MLKYEPYEGANGIAEIVWLGTDENNKRKGLASRLVKYIENYSKEREIRKLYVKTSSNNKIANCFWIMQDYKFESRMLDFSMVGHDDYYLGKALSDKSC